MKRILPFVFVLLAQLVYGQSTRDVIESPRSKDGNIYFDQDLQMSLIPGKVKFSRIKKGQVISIKRSEDHEAQSDAGKREFAVYVKAYNPLNYSLNSSSKVIVDSLNYRLNTALEEMWKILDAYKGKTQENGFIKSIECPEKCHCPHDSILNIQLLAVFELFRKEQKKSKDYVEWSKQLIEFDFASKRSTSDQLIQMELNLKVAKDSYKELYDKVDVVRTDILKKLDGTNTQCAISLEVWLNKVNRIKGLIDDQKKFLDNFERLLQQMQKTIKSWKSHEVNGTWFILVEEGNVSRDSSVLVTVSMTEHLMSIDGNNQLRLADSKEKAIASIHLIWHRNFVPEVSAGVYYSLQSQDSYNMAADGSGGGTIVQIGQRDFEGIAISSMLNFYLNKQDWRVLPFWQVGLGLQKEMPLFMCGLGTRFGLKDRAFSVACGLSLTAIKGLDDLNVGDVVKDESEIKSDLRYQFSGPKFYFGIQFHF
ncbi:hypothetical protein [Fluviicola sp.]|uniref:hypothetical protein n=1 Tax=Fluviicola sp. TaxID=1917219 RepID=UPI0031DF8641